ncbi:hypothetical protein [Phenylobacterium sp. J367]|uniref:hypothetical protein n=1 Tax=Phenylobacterium sp. J367 TaxID=2898435 RepID=UPI002151B78D|nr:hypothetical protein [Phenylobacterium sp. J367]MCR5878414.1 hypothetical protein [Phenylobacterium sp. J367]
MVRWSDQLRLLTELRDAPPIAYRKRDPGPEDYDTYLMRPAALEIEGYYCITLDVVRDIRFREVLTADRDAQTVRASFEATDEVELAHIVMVPELGVLAVEDRTGEGRLAGSSAAHRLQAMVETRRGFAMQVTQAGGPHDLQLAIRTWELEQFSFQARPFNPHPSTPGEMLSDMMAQDDIGVMRGVAKPKDGRHIKPESDGLVQETLGLAEKGYATYGLKGRTPSGAEAVVDKPPFSHDRQKNLERLNGPQKLRIYVEADTQEEQDRKAVRVLIEFFVPILQA